MALTEQEMLELIQLSRSVEFFYDIGKWSDAELKKLLRAVRQAETELLARIEYYGSSLASWDEERTIALLDNFQRMTVGIRSVLENGITLMAAESGAAAYLAFNDIVSFGGRIKNFNSVSLTAEQLRELISGTPVGGKLLEEWVADTYGNVAEEIRNEIMTGMLKGDSIPEFVNRLSNGFDMSKQDAISLSRTYTQSVNVNAMMDVYQNNSDIIKGVRWTATLENSYKKTGRGVCLKCLLIDGRVYRLDEEKPILPAHPR